MGRIRVLSDQVANQIAAGEVVERPASVVKELLENALDARATRIRIEVEAGGRKLIRIADDGHGMGRDDSLLAFERHATSKLRSSDDLLQIATLGFRGEALPSIASVSRLTMETRAPEDEAGTLLEIAGGKLLRVEDLGRPAGTTLTIRDLFFNTPARRKFLRSESTELQHVAALVTHYALANPTKHFELHSATHALLVAPAVTSAADRMFQIFGRETVDQMIPVAAETDFARVGIPEPPPWKRDENYEPPEPGVMRISGFISKPELQKLNRNSIYVFVNGRLIRDRLVLHALSEAYRNVIPPTSFPVVLLFLDVPPAEVDVNVHPAKTEVRFRQQSIVHDFLRDSVRTALMAARPVMSFAMALTDSPLAAEALRIDVSPMPGAPDLPPASEGDPQQGDAASFSLQPDAFLATEQRIVFPQQDVAPADEPPFLREPEQRVSGRHSCSSATPEEGEERPETLHSLATLRAVGQLRNSFILAVNEDGLWIIDQHVAHERVLFEKILRERRTESVQRQRLLMPLLVDLQPAQMLAFAELADELDRNGFEAEPFGPRTLAVKAAPVGLEGKELEHLLDEVLADDRTGQVENAEARRTRIAASIACHAAIKINMPLDPAKIEWLLAELAKTQHPTSCPHGRPIALRYSLKEIQRAFNRI
ncbi:MAG: DNA mismatch repair endonuclease MutL [Acidobacteriaceae bacterium]|nr:DNA mismatch repair endonuclease MutL [Acidobacteriaceae bacterium]